MNQTAGSSFPFIPRPAASLLPPSSFLLHALLENELHLPRRSSRWATRARCAAGTELRVGGASGAAQQQRRLAARVQLQLPLVRRAESPGRTLSHALRDDAQR